MSAADRFTAEADLAAAREEKRAAAHIIALLKIGADDDAPQDEEVGAALRRARGITPGPVMFVRRREIELQVAELRLSLWSEECRRLEQIVRAMGVRP